MEDWGVYWEVAVRVFGGSVGFVERELRACSKMWIFLRCLLIINNYFKNSYLNKENKGVW